MTSLRVQLVTLGCRLLLGTPARQRRLRRCDAILLQQSTDRFELNNAKET